MTQQQSAIRPEQGQRDQNTPGLVHVTLQSGHRGEYQELFSQMFDLQPSVGPIGGRQMLMADRLFFATLDDDIPGFARIALRRALRGRRTLGLFLRPQSCLGSGVRMHIKRRLMQVLCAVPGVSVLSIIPATFVPAISTVSTDWGHDPQLWDQIDAPSSPDEAMRASVAQLADGRPVLAFLGRASRIKGLPKLAALLKARPDLTRKIAVVVAGSVDAECKTDAAQLAASGATVWDRRITDAELSALYEAAGLVWANYDASYDQASGIFGRAIQCGRAVVIREGAMLQRYADILNHPCLSLPDDPSVAADLLEQFVAQPGRTMPENTPATLRLWRTTFSETVRSRL